jgi:hypothetical protein
MQTILAIGGAVIKTAYDEIKEAAHRKLFDALIHNGGSVFHDFQLATEKLDGHSHPLTKLLEDYTINQQASRLVWAWVRGGEAPRGSLTYICEQADIPVYMFTVPGADFWHLFDQHWELLGYGMKADFSCLCDLMRNGPFRFISMGSAVVHPEVFTKALAVAKPHKFTAEVVDFLPDQYRPKTRVACFGEYHYMTHKKFLEHWLLEGGEKE